MVSSHGEHAHPFCTRHADGAALLLHSMLQSGKCLIEIAPRDQFAYFASLAVDAA